MITVKTNKTVRNIHNFWNHIHFHPADAIEDDWGIAILDRVAADGVAKAVRFHAMLEDIVTRDEEGNLCYDFSEGDVRMDYMVAHGFEPVVCYCFIPPCLADDPTQLSSNSVGKTRYKGKMICTSAPTDYNEWEEVCYQYTKHLVDRYGIDEVRKWRLQCYNEPDHGGFFLSGLGWGEGTLEKRIGAYLPLYTHFARAITRVDERLCFGGPVTTSSGKIGPVAFFEAFLKFLKDTDTRCDFICSHNYSTSDDEIKSGERLLNSRNLVDKVQLYVDLIHKYFPEGKEFIVDEWGAFNRGFKGLRVYPVHAFREHSGYAAFMGRMIAQMAESELPVEKMLICLSGQHDMPEEFAGQRSLFTKSGIEKPIYHAYYLTSKLGDRQLETATDDGNLTVFATADKAGKVTVMLAYAHENYAEIIPALNDTVQVKGLDGTYRLTRWLVDREHACAYTLYCAEEMPPEPTAEQMARLRQAARLTPTVETVTAAGALEIPVSATPNALILLELERV